LAQQGFQTIIANRPDGEAADQPTFAAIEAAAKEAGLNVRYIPIVPGQMTAADIEAFDTALTEMEGPVLAYCRTGTRSATLWSLSQSGKRPAAEILAATEAAGYDMSGIAGRLGS